jgi:N-acetylglutamate synthase-like GNAT family acetyltransferase
VPESSIRIRLFNARILGFAAMNAMSYRLRRATMDDLPQLGVLLKATLLPADLEKRFTEFQVAESPEGNLVGALGLQVIQKQGQVHGETYLDFGLADTLRPLLWERLQTVAQNHGLVRLWTRETAPFWKQAGFAGADPEVMKKFPPGFGEQRPDWLTLKLKEDIETVLSLDKEFSLFMESEKARTEEVFAQARMLKGFAWVLTIALVLFVAIAVVFLLKNNPGILKGLRGNR